MLQSGLPGFGKSMIAASILGLFLTLSTMVFALETNHIARWVHTGFHQHEKSYEDERVVLFLLKNSSFDLKYTGYFENDDDVTWEKNMEASGRYEIRGNDIIFTIEVLVGSEDREKPNYRCPFTLNKKALILSRCELLNRNITYKFKPTDPDAFLFN